MAEVVLNNIVKSYNKGEVIAVNNVSFEVNKGELYGLIGPDGAGKTSIFRILTTLILPDSGTASVSGYDVVKNYKIIRKKVGYMPGKFSLYQDLTVEENINFFATVFGTTVKENYDLIRDIYVQLEPFKSRKAGKLSGGMKQKLALCCALIHRPIVLFLDEPTTGVDTISRKEFWEMIKKLKQEGITILVSTPYMDEAKLCDRIALILNGRIISIETPNNIIKKFPDKLYAIKANNMGKLLNDLRNNKLIKTCFAFGEFHHITFQNDGINMQSKLIENLQNAGYQNIEIKEITPNIEDCFINLMN
ncbi:ABC-type multidrug transport system ATPase subunit [Thermoflavifilum aggregans]|uniref:ABC-type multidrug transport system ATPase subunit n=1 Tax=Thermoflavifilum aggregans TaxID=454188 RepID=A0A2M9CWJ7_9BACT|nr:ABC transporter ATP-binding protein [Thermoflavifilum aggregans]PJJ76178.1 ABC-type multidrug transport system ATPase subunit [Thermoflavifilum aggregans]